ncbi:hypothetical protein S1361_17325 [Streptomyces cyanogenus]|uniref:Uncharacterized protein n=2 Tax=Streptomyces cyanogenus TaxID=80860 RepID=A0ABX7TQY4_STRCY|nr:hypothetical protein S1361_17325 [Streptomyces cyanogenus]
MTHWLTTAMLEDAQFFGTVRNFVEQAPSPSVNSEVIAKVYNNYQNAKIGKIVNVETVHGDLNF